MSRGKVTLEEASWTLWLLVCLPLGHRDRPVNMRRSASSPGSMDFEFRCERCRRREWRTK